MCASYIIIYHREARTMFYQKYLIINFSYRKRKWFWGKKNTGERVLRIISNNKIKSCPKYFNTFDQKPTFSAKLANHKKIQYLHVRLRRQPRLEHE